MKKREFKIGDKVKIPKTKSTGININYSLIQNLIKKEKHDYLIVEYVTNLNAFEQRIACMFPTSETSSYFLNTDLEHYEKEIIGYKLIKPEYEEAALKITGMTNQHWTGFSDNKFLKTEKWSCTDYEKYVAKLKEAGVLDIWFEPVYKEKKQIIQMYSSNKGMFEIEVVDGKAYYRPENKELPKEWVKKIIKRFMTINTVIPVYPYLTEVTKVNVGCMHDTRKEDWENLYKLLK